MTWQDRARGAFPGGSNGEFNLPPDLVTVVARGSGCHIHDVEGRRYLDMSMGWGSVLPGHAHPEILDAARRALPGGTNFATLSHASLMAAEAIMAASPACDQVRFCASGTEATMHCLRLARAYTGRSHILKFDGAYHGSNDVGVTSLFSERSVPWPDPVRTCSGVSDGELQSILVAPFNNLDATANILRAYADKLAGVIVEPMHRCLPPVDDFLSGLRRITSELGLVLIFDEVVTGFRLAYGGAQETWGVTPDLVAYGKALGGGFPVGVFGGRGDIMDTTREARMGSEAYVWSASTLGGNPITAAVILATLRLYREQGAYARLHALGAYLRSNMNRALLNAGVAGTVLGYGPLAQVLLTHDPHPVTSSSAVRRGHAAAGRALMILLFRRGIFLNPMGTKLYLSMAHTEADCDAFCAILEMCLREVSEEFPDCRIK